jgi:hypothetical protein
VVTVCKDHGDMKSQVADRTGILILHLWCEENAPEGFRARITQTLDSTVPSKTMATAANPEDLLSAVRSWVEEFLHAETPPATAP